MQLPLQPANRPRSSRACALAGAHTQEAAAAGAAPSVPSDAVTSDIDAGDPREALEQQFMGVQLVHRLGSQEVLERARRLRAGESGGEGAPLGLPRR